MEELEELFKLDLIERNIEQLNELGHMVLSLESMLVHGNNLEQIQASLSAETLYQFLTSKDGFVAWKEIIKQDIFLQKKVNKMHAVSGNDTIQ